MITKISISLPSSMEKYARWRVRTGGYGSVSEYFRELVRIDTRFERERVIQDNRIKAEADTIQANSGKKGEMPYFPPEGLR